VCYAFEPVDPAAKVNPDKLITTKLHQQVGYTLEKPTPEAVNAAMEEMKKIEQKTGIPVGEVRCRHLPPMSLNNMEARVPDVPCLKKIWSSDCNPKEYKEDTNGLPVEVCPPYAKPWHPSALQVASTPVFYKNKVYVAIGTDANGGKEGGNLVCIDATRKGDMKSGEWLWNYKMGRTASTVSIADGLVYVADFGATVYCFDAESGKKYWEYHCVPESEMASGWGGRGSDGSGHCYSSTMVADGKVFITTIKGALYILATGREPKLLGKVDLGSQDYATPSAVGNTLLVPSGKYLWAVQDKGAVAPAL